MNILEKIDTILYEAAEPIFDTNTASELVTKLEKGIKVPFIKIQKSTLGGKDKPSVLVTISLDPKESWANGIFENSRHMRFHVNLPNVIEQFQLSKIKTKFRKTKAKNIDDVVKKIKEYVEKTKKEVSESLDEGILQLKLSPKDKKEIMKTLDGLGVDYSDAGTYELDVEVSDKKAAKKLLAKLPQGIRYTLN